MKNTSAGLLIIYNENILLVQQRYDKQGVHLSIPKGKIVDNETPIQAAIRETYEETGLLISQNQIEKTPFLFTIRTSEVNRHVIYYIVRIKHLSQKLEPMDSDEILKACFMSYQIAEKKLQVSQLSVLLHIVPNKIPSKALGWLIANGYIDKSIHPLHELVLYNYTEKCKRHQYWNEITLWCRGIIMDNSDNIKFKPLKKFFEIDQLYDVFLPPKEQFELYEKKDGSLGILYWADDIPYITTRGSFTSTQAIEATALLYNKYAYTISYLDRKLSYYFEIILPEDKHIVNYKDCRDLFLIGAFNNILQKEIRLNELDYLPFKKVKSIINKLSLEELQKENYENEEGYVALFPNGQRVKIKFQSYKEKYAKRYF